MRYVRCLALPVVAILAASGMTGCGSSKTTDPKADSTAPTIKRLGREPGQPGGVAKQPAPTPKANASPN